MQDAIRAFQSPDRYYRCLLLVAPDVARLERVATRLAADEGWPALALNSLLAEALLNTPPGRRQKVAVETFASLVESRRGPTLCYRIELLFQPELELDPLALFREASRNTPLVIAWPGHYQEGRLSYAVPEHAHYRFWRDPEVLAISLEEEEPYALR